MLRFISRTPHCGSIALRTSARSMFIQTAITPNPHSLKFLPGQDVLEEKYGTGLYFQINDLAEIKKSPLARGLFSITGIKGIFFGRDFITVTKETDESWHILKPLVFSEILDFYAGGKPILETSGAASDTAILDSDDEVVATIKELIETRVRPAVQEDGGDIFYHGFDPTTGIVSVRLAGACVGCASSSVTLRNGVENMLMHYVPEVKGIAQVQNEGEDASITSATV